MDNLEQEQWAREGSYTGDFEGSRQSSRVNDSYQLPFAQQNPQPNTNLENLPVFNIRQFSGDGQDAARWIFNLRREFRKAGIIKVIPPDMWIGAIWGGVEGKAIQWMDSAPHLKHIINLLRSMPHLITKEMADQFTEEFEETFRLVEEPENQQSPIEMLNSLEQGRNEPLADYYTRARGVLQLLGVKGLPQRDPSFSVMRAAIIEMTVSRVVSGLSDDALKVKAIERGVASSSTLEECFRIIRDVRNSMIDARKQFLSQRENWKSKCFDRILKAPNQVTEVLQDFTYRYNNLNELHQNSTLAYRSTPQQSYITPILNQNALPSAARQSTSRSLSMPNSQGMNEYPREVKLVNIDDDNPWKQQADYALQVQKTEVKYQGPEYRGENPWKGESSWATRWQNRNEQAVPSQNADRKGKGREDMITPQYFHSSHPMVNGEIEYRNVCWRCGNGPNADSPRHDNRHCQHPPLQNWESEVLKDKHRQKKEAFERRETQPRSFNQSSAQLTTNEVEIEQRRRQRYEAAGLPQPHFEEHPMARNKAVEEISVEELIALDKLTEQSESKINAVDGSLDEYLFDEPLEVDTSKTSFPRNTITAEKTKEQSPTESEILLSAHVVDRDNTKRPRTHHDILNDEDIEPLPKASSQDDFTQFHGRAKLRRRQIEPLINARINEGPLDYMKILGRTKVEVSLTDLAQMSPAARKHWKHGMSRVNDKRSRKKRRQAEISEVASNSFNHTDSSKDQREINFHKNQMINNCNRQSMTYKSFRVEAKVETTINGQKKYIVLDVNYTHVDQGADLNLISNYLAKVLRLQSLKLPKPILFATAEGRLTNATHFSQIKISVAGVWRCVEALVLPPATGNLCSLILGLPWLFDVCGNLDIPTFTLKIGDTSRGEKTVNIQTTKFKLGQNNRLRLILADQRAMELARAQICARDAESKRSEKHVQILSGTESESSNNDEGPESDSDISSEEEDESGKENVTGVTLKRLSIRKK